ncbi:3-hydroxyisobutyrate dehydrogenase-like beta-hydroxyacid dehydrogenase [Mycobacterium sp. MAA66]|uniref:NAD(P)-dependent oxidoreductase n=1 Tax=Mycobacterium sp. MAA66 TaxID=3156297 RepID=UPI0035110732
MQVGFIGAGRMGAPMVRQLVEAGHQVRALGRTDEKRSALAELGAVPTNSIRAVTDGADAVVVCVFTDDQVQQICEDLPAEMAPGAVLILHTTGSPRTAQRIAEQHPHVGVIDAPVSGGPHDIAAGTVTLFVGGADETVASARPILGAYGDPVLHVGPLGAGQTVKLINNAMFAAQIGVVAEGARIGTSLGVAEADLLAALGHGSSASKVLGMVARAGSADGFIAAVAEFVGKDVAVVRDTAAGLNTELGLLDPLLSRVTGTPAP